MKKMDKEVILGGVFGAIAIMAVIVEMILGGFSAEVIAGGVKDIAGTMVAVLVFIIAVSSVRKRNVKGFDNVFRAEMERVIAKYDPAIIECTKENKKENFYRYDIARYLDCISGNAPGAYYLFFELKENIEVNSISFKITKTVFDDKKVEVAEAVGLKVLSVYKEKIKNTSLKEDFITIEFAESLTSDDDAVFLADVVDCVLLVCVAKYRGKK